MRSVGRLLAWVLPVVAALGVAARAAEDPSTVDWDRVKREWTRMSAGERAGYDQMMKDLARASMTAPKSSESCASSEFEITTLPFVDDNTTEGHAETIFLSAFGACAGGGPQFSGTGFGPDLVYKVKTSVDCDLVATLEPETADMALYVVRGSCTDPAVNCVGVDDAGGTGATESVAFSASSEDTYFVVVDGFNLSSGPFRLTIAESSATGCELVPVVLQQFTVE